MGFLFPGKEKPSAPTAPAAPGIRGPSVEAQRKAEMERRRRRSRTVLAGGGEEAETRAKTLLGQ